VAALALERAATLATLREGAVKATRTELFWLAALWLCNVQRDIEVAEFTAKFYEAYSGPAFDRLHELSIRPHAWMPSVRA
jgi:hypothetical protein